ncbi:unnamed protein product [Kuraishia capsulata CBS 1993]|uniref:Amino acid permease/ SLC12A domain-containing protein n=1 Tax=Kuraishia capsulata CBS 1993 TaxID=1382522 RepID=W6MRA8_9ASCO|nr:uncharacterized protein KUCA_T00004883001 [Kuraishia capsulata CBS 1993]CDK28898.1 unnamed protein product [Kuraishia capsulata CBS 1993]
MADVEPIRSTATVISVDDFRVQSVLSHHSKKIIVEHDVDSDEAVILALGYKQEFKREFSLWTTFGVSFSVLGLLPSIASTMWYSLGYAGNAGLTWAWLIAMIGIQCVANSMAELSSAFPTSGGLYYSTAQLAPPKWAPFFSWCVGWSNYLVQITGAPSVDYGGACMILALKTFNDPDFTPTNGQTYLLTMALTTVNAVISSMPTAWIAKFNSFGSTCNLMFLLIVFIMILAGDNRSSQGLSKFNDNSAAWGITNFTEWPDGMAILMSFMAVIWTMSGYDSPFHLAEECSNAQIATPRAIVLTATTGGLIGFVFQLAIAYAIVDVDAAINDSLGQPFVTFLSQCLDKKLVYTATAMTIVSSFCMGEACQVAASRVTYAYSRDGCFPLSRYWAKVHPITKTPVNAVWFNWFVGQLLLLLIFAGGSAIDAIFSVGALGAFMSFTFPILLRITYARNTFKPGPWNLGRWSIVSGTIACSFVVLMIPILCFPEYRGADNTPEWMNWTVLVYFGPMLLAILWFAIDARKWFTGPKTNLGDLLVDGEEAENVIDGKISKGESIKYSTSKSPDLEKS